MRATLAARGPAPSICWVWGMGHRCRRQQLIRGQLRGVSSSRRQPGSLRGPLGPLWRGPTLAGRVALADSCGHWCHPNPQREMGFADWWTIATRAPNSHAACGSYCPPRGGRRGPRPHRMPDPLRALNPWLMPHGRMGPLTRWQRSDEALSGSSVALPNHSQLCRWNLPAGWSLAACAHLADSTPQRRLTPGAV